MTEDVKQQSTEQEVETQQEVVEEVAASIDDDIEIVEETVVSLDPLEEAQARIAELEATIVQQQENILRAKADLENLRRRSQEEVTKTHKYASESFAKELLAVKDSLEAALAQEDQALESLLEGVQTTLKQLNGVFERHKVKEIAPVVGDAFDPNVHQAISTIPSDAPANHIAQVLQKGYLMSERVLRPALVMVSMGQSK